MRFLGSELSSAAPAIYVQTRAHYDTGGPECLVQLACTHDATREGLPAELFLCEDAHELSDPPHGCVELGIRLGSGNVVFQTKRTNPVVFEHVNTGDCLHGIDGRQLPAGGKKAAKALGSPEFWGGSAASGIGAGLFTTQTPVYNPARVYSAPPVDAGVARTATLAAAAPPTIVSAGGLGAVGVADGDVILKAVVNGARVDAAAMDGAAFAAALASAAGSVVLESVLTLRDPVFGQDPCVQRSLLVPQSSRNEWEEGGACELHSITSAVARSRVFCPKCVLH